MKQTNPHSKFNAETESLVADVVKDFLQRLESGEQPKIEEYTNRHPEIADVLREVLSTLQMLETVSLYGKHISRTDDLDESSKRTLGDFRIIREIGRGGMGVVYEAEQISLDRRVALKVLPFASVLDDRQLQRFKNEAQAAAQLHHTNIVPVFSVGCERGVHYYAMQFVKGPTLANVIRELRRLSGLDTAQPGSGNGTISRLAEDLTSGRFAPVKQAGADGSSGEQTAPDETATSTLGTLAKEHSTKSPEFFRSVANLAMQAAKALEYAHSNGIIHRDIKPSNLLLDVKGTLWVTDFGLAHFRSDTGLKLTMSGDLLGTVRYMSSEQALGKHALLDHRTDIYSLGVTLYELLTLEPAFTGRDRQELLRQITDEEPRALRRLNEATPTDLETIVLKATAKEPEARYATAQELSDDLQRFLEDKPIKAKRPTLAQRAAKWSRRHRQVVWASIVLLIVVAAGSTIGTFLLARKQVEVVRQRDRAEGNLRLAMQALDEIYLKLAEKQLPQAEYIDEADRELLQKALMFYEQFAAENRTSVESRYETAKAYIRVGEIREKLGEYTEAEQAYGQAISLCKKLVADYPGMPEYRSDLAKALRKLSYVLSLTGRKEQVGTYLRQAIDIGEKLVADVPEPPEFRHQLSVAYGRMGQWLRETGSLEEAEKNLRRSVELAEKLAIEFPDEPEYRNDLAGYCHNLSELLSFIGRSEEAEQYLRRSIELGEKLVAEFPSESDSRNRLAQAYRDLGYYVLRGRNRQESEDAYRRCIEIAEKLVADFPAVPVYRNTLGNAYQVFGFVQKDPNDKEEAFRRSLQIHERLTADFPTVPDHENNVAAAHFTLGRLLMNIGRSEEAEEHYRRALEIQEQLISENPSVLKYRDSLSTCCSCFGLLLKKTDQLEEAEKVYRKGLEVDEQLASEYPAATEYQSDLVTSASNLSYLYKSTGRLKEAEEVLRDALAFCEKLMVENPSVTSLPHQAQLLHNLGVFLTDAGHPEEAEKLYSQTLNHYAKFMADSPDSPRYRTCMAAAFNDLAWRCATYPDPTHRAPTWAVKFAEKAVESVPEEASFWNTLGVSRYRTGQLQEASEALQKSMELSSGGGSNEFFLAMAHWQLGNREQARQWYDKAVEWMEQNRPDDYELRRFRVEAEVLLGIVDVPIRDRDAQIWYRHATAQSDADRPQEAGRCYLEALRTYKKLAADSPNDDQLKEELDKCSDQYGWYLATCHNPKYRDPNHVIELSELKITNRLACMNNLAVLYANNGRFEDVRPLLEETLQISRRLLGEQHPTSLICERNLASLKAGLSNAGSEHMFEKAQVVIPPENLEIPDEMEPCAENLREIYAAIQKYRQDKGTWPDWLCDLIPEYLSEETLKCPADDNCTLRRDRDPNFPSSYRYQLSPDTGPAGSVASYRDSKTAEVQVYGDVVPLVRCYSHSSNMRLDITFGGQLCWNHSVWARTFYPDHDEKAIVESILSQEPEASVPDTQESDHNEPILNAEEVKQNKGQ